MENRQAKRNQIQVDIEIAQPSAGRCYGYAENVSRTGLTVALCEGVPPSHQRSVILNFRVWTGRETLYRRIYGRVVRSEQGEIVLEFSRADFTAEAVIRELMFFQRQRDRAARLHRNSDSFIQHQLSA